MRWQAQRLLNITESEKMSKR